MEEALTDLSRNPWVFALLALLAVISAIGTITTAVKAVYSYASSTVTNGWQSLSAWLDGRIENAQKEIRNSENPTAEIALIILKFIGKSTILLMLISLTIAIISVVLAVKNIDAIEPVKRPPKYSAWAIYIVYVYSAACIVCIVDWFVHSIYYTLVLARLSKGAIR